MKEKFMLYLQQFIDLPYIWGGDNPKRGVDCSGLVQLLLGYLGLDPKGDQSAEGLREWFLAHGEEIQLKDATLGCLIFYGRPGHATHVALLIAHDTMIEAGGGGPWCVTPAVAKLRGAKVRFASPLRRSDILCVIKPSGLDESLKG